MKYKYPYPKINHPIKWVETSNKMSLHDSVSGCHQMIPLPINQHKAIFKVPWRNYIFDQMLPGLRGVEDAFQRTMAPIFNFFTMIYIDDIIICFHADKEWFFDLRGTFDRNKFGKKDSKNKYQGKHGLFEIFWKNPYIMFSSGGSCDFFLQELKK